MGGAATLLVLRAGGRGEERRGVGRGREVRMRGAVQKRNQARIPKMPPASHAAGARAEGSSRRAGSLQPRGGGPNALPTLPPAQPRSSPSGPRPLLAGGRHEGRRRFLAMAVGGCGEWG